MALAPPAWVRIRHNPAAANPIIPADRLYSAWPTAGISQGAGIPDRTTIHTTLNAATYGNGSSDATSAIQSALDACPAGQVVKLSAGVFRVNGQIDFGNGNQKTLRGSGMLGANQTTLRFYTPSGGWTLQMGNGSAGYNGAPDFARGTPTEALTVSGAKGDTTLTMATTADFSVGDVIWISIADEPNTPIVQLIGGPAYWRRFVTKVLSKTGTVLTIQDPLPYAMPLSLDPQVHPISDGFAWRCGLEDISLDFANVTVANIQTNTRMWNADECWFREVEIKNTTNFSLHMMHALHCQVQKCFIHDAEAAEANHSGILLEQSTLCLIIDNIIARQYPHLEMNFFCSGNVFAYNYIRDNSWGGTQGSALDINHGAHNSFNLFEGNCSPSIDSDGYFGGASHETLFRNRLHGTNPDGTVDGDLYDGSHCLEINRIARYYNAVENVLGALQTYWSSITPAQTLKYELTASNEFGPAIYRLGYPNTGNQTYVGTAQKSLGDNWVDWTSEYLARLIDNNSPGHNTSDVFQERDLDVEATMLRKGNYNAYHQAVPAAESISGYDAAPASYWSASKPSWFFGLAWPPYGTGGSTSFDINASLQRIPAGYRYHNSHADPPA